MSSVIVIIVLNAFESCSLFVLAMESFVKVTRVPHSVASFWITYCGTYVGINKHSHPEHSVQL